MSKDSNGIFGADVRASLVIGLVLAVAVVGLVFSGVMFTGVVEGDVINNTANNVSDGAILSDWDPQFVNSSTVDRYQVTIKADDPDDLVALLRQRPQIGSTTRQKIIMNSSFGPAMNPEIVAFEGDGGALGDLSGPEFVQKNIFVDGDGNVVIELTDPAQGAQGQRRITSITVEFDALSPSTPGTYNFPVEMQSQDTVPGQVQNFDTINDSGIAQVTVVNASSADPGELEVVDLETDSSAPQDEKQLEVTGTIDNTNTTANLTADVVYGLEENVDPAFAGGDLLTQTAPNVAVPAGGSANVTFFVDLTEEDEAINTSDDIRHGIDVLGNNITQPLTITDGPIDHFEDPSAPLNRTTGLIQTAVDISSDADDDVVVVNPGGSPPFASGSPYGENVTVDVDNIVIRGNTTLGKPAVLWAGPQPPDFAINPPFTVESTTNNVTIRDLQIEPLIPEAGGVDVLGGSNHSVLNNDVVGTNTGPPGSGVSITGVTNPAVVSGNEIANTSNGIVFNGTSNGFVTNNIVRRNSRTGILLEVQSNNNTLRDNMVNRNGRDGIGLDSSDGNNLTDNDAISNARNGIALEFSDGNNLTSNNASDGGSGIFVASSVNNDLVNNEANSTSRNGIFLGSADNNNLTGNDASLNRRNGIILDSGADGNNLTDNTANGNDIRGIFVRDSQNNAISESLTENNNVGILFLDNQFGFSSLEQSGNTFTNDTSRNNNNLDFFVITSGTSSTVGTTQSVSDFPVTNLDIGASTNPNTKLSFNANDMGLASVNNPQPDPADATNISRFFFADTATVLDTAQDDGGAITPQSGIPFLNVSLSYDDPGDLGTVDESTLELRRFNTTSGAWETVPGSTRDTANDLVSANITQFSNFGAFGQGEGRRTDCINRRDLSRGQEELECPFDSDISRGGSREELDRESGRAGEGRHRDSATARRNRGRGSRSR